MAKVCSFHGCRLVEGRCLKCEDEREVARWLRRMVKRKESGRFLSRRKRNAGVPGEGPAEHVANALQILGVHLEFNEPLTMEEVRAVVDRLKIALALLREWQAQGRLPKVNPATLAIVSNPPLGGGRVMGDAVYEIAYRHVHDGEDYIHEFERPDRVRLAILSPTQVLLDGGRMPIVDLFHVGGA